MYTYRNTVTGIEFSTVSEVRGSNLVRLEPSAPIVEEVKAAEPVETKPKKAVKRGAKK